MSSSQADVFLRVHPAAKALKAKESYSYVSQNMGMRQS
jgi:hypothetical protein